MTNNQVQIIVWTPVSKCLPKDEGKKLVTTQNKKGVCDINRAWCDAQGFWHGSGSMAGVTAWAEMPEPYSGEEVKKFGFCGNCKWCQFKNLDHFPDELPVLECHNPDSLDYGEETDFVHGCEDWKLVRIIGNDECGKELN